VKPSRPGRTGYPEDEIRRPTSTARRICILNHLLRQDNRPRNPRPDRLCCPPRRTAGGPLRPSENRYLDPETSAKPSPRDRPRPGAEQCGIPGGIPIGTGVTPSPSSEVRIDRRSRPAPREVGCAMDIPSPFPERHPWQLTAPYSVSSSALPARGDTPARGPVRGRSGKPSARRRGADAMDRFSARRAPRLA